MKDLSQPYFAAESGLPRFDLIDWRSVFAFRTFDRKLAFFSEIPIDTSQLARLFPVRTGACEVEEADDIFYLLTSGKHGESAFYWNGALLEKVDDRHIADPTILDWKVQLSLALIFSENLTFIHGGAVAYKDKVILVVGNSRSGKTTLTHEFLKAGADYLTDDCTVIDSKGCVLAYPGDLRIRVEGEPMARKIVKPSELGASVPKDPLPVSHVIFTEFENGRKWEPQVIGKGEAVWGLMQNLFYSGAATVAPKGMMERLAKAVEEAVCLKGPRGEAAELVARVLEFRE